MAGAAIVRESGLRVVRIGGTVVILGVAREAIGGYSLEIIVGVTRLAVEGGMNSREREVRELGMIELRAEPTIQAVTDRAVGGKSQRFVVEHRRLEILLVTGKTLRREANVLSSGCSFVTRFAIESGVRTHQRKAVLVLID